MNRRVWIVVILLSLSHLAWGGFATAWRHDNNQIDRQLADAHHDGDKQEIISRLILGGTDSLARLTGYLTHRDAVVRRTAAKGFYRLGPLAFQEQRALTKLAANSDDEVRGWIFRALLRMNSHGIAVVFKSLRAGDEGRLAEYALRERLGLSESVFDGFFTALKKVLRQQTEAEPVLVLAHLAQNASAEVSLVSLSWLKEFREEAKPAMPYLVNALHHPDPRIIRMAASVIGAIGRRAHAAKQDLVGVLVSNNPMVRIAALSALWKLGYGDSFMDASKAVLTHHDPSIRRRLLQSLVEYRFHHPMAARHLVPLFLQENDPVNLRLYLQWFSGNRLFTNPLAFRLWRLLENRRTPVAVKLPAMDILARHSPHRRVLFRHIQSVVADLSIAEHIRLVAILSQMGMTDSRPVIKAILPYMYEGLDRKMAVLRVLETAERIDFTKPYLVNVLVHQRTDSRRARNFYVRLARLISRLDSGHHYVQR